MICTNAELSLNVNGILDSCDGNLKSGNRLIRGQRHIVLTSIKDIRADEELSYDYLLSVADDIKVGSYGSPFTGEGSVVSTRLHQLQYIHIDHKDAVGSG